MKKILLFLITFFLLSIYCYSQPRNTTENNQLKKELTDSIGKLKKQISVLEYKLGVSDSVVKNNFKVLANSIESTKKSIDDTRLRESLKSAESTINKQNFLIDGFGNIFTFLTILIALLTIGLPLYTIYINSNIKMEVKESIKEAQSIQRDIVKDHNNLKDKIEKQILSLNKEKEDSFKEIKKDLNTKFEEYLNNSKKQKIDQAIINLSSDQMNFIVDACSIISHTPIGDFSNDHFLKLVNILRKQKLSIDRYEMLIHKIAEKQCEYTDSFFNDLYTLSKTNTANVRIIAYYYFAENDILNYKETFIKLILNSENSTLEYNSVIECWQSGYQDSIIQILNFEELQNKEKIDLNLVYQKLQASYNYRVIENQVKQSTFYNKLIYKE